MKYSTEECLKAILEKPFEEGWDENEEPPFCNIYQEVFNRIKPFNTFLEVGPGIGDLSLYLLNQGKTVEMIDITEHNLKTMRKICDEKKYPYIFNLQDIVEVTISLLKSYDVVVAVEVIEHIEDYKQAINNMISLAKHKVVLTTPVLSSFWSPDHKHFFSEKDFKFIEKPYTIKQIVAKKIDIPTTKRNFLIEINVS